MLLAVERLCAAQSFPLVVVLEKILAARHHSVGV